MRYLKIGAILIVITIIGIDMYNSKKTVWFDGSNEVNCNIELVKNSFEDVGTYFVEVTKCMAGISSAKLVEQGADYVTIQTNEGLMKRTGITKKIDNDKVVIEFDENYKAGSAITTNSHIKEEFEAIQDKVSHRVTITQLKAPGFLGFFYRNFGSSNIGNAFLEASKTYYEKLAIN